MALPPTSARVGRLADVAAEAEEADMRQVVAEGLLGGIHRMASFALAQTRPFFAVAK